MGIKSAKKSNAYYKVDGLLFPTRFIFTTIESTDGNLGFLYNPGSAENDYVPIIDFSLREDDEVFNAFADRVEERIDRIENIDDGSTKHFLYKEKIKNCSFIIKFPSIYACFNEAMNMDSETEDHQKQRIFKIVTRLYLIGINLF